MMLLLAAARRGAEYDRIMRQGWRYRIGQGDLLGVRVTGKRLASSEWAGSAERLLSGRAALT